MTEPSYELFDRTTTAIIYGYHRRPIQRMLDFDYICRREKPSVAAIVNPARAGLHKAFFGTEEILIPMYRTVAQAAAEHPEADVMVNFASFRSAFPTTMEALDQPTIRTVAVIAEGVPERKARVMAATAQKLGKVIIG
ncbi:MAG: ATP citrate synthase, partial [Chloroflexota bacterium]|nr:ATP citrate synthase [Chloroflexota bacterium]